MVFMGMSDNDTGQMIGAFGNKSRVGHLYMGLMCLIRVGKGDAAVNH